MIEGSFFGGEGGVVNPALYMHHLIHPRKSSLKGIFVTEGDSEARRRWLTSPGDTENPTHIFLTSKSSLSTTAILRP